MKKKLISFLLSSVMISGVIFPANIVSAVEIEGTAETVTYSTETATDSEKTEETGETSQETDDDVQIDPQIAKKKAILEKKWEEISKAHPDGNFGYEPDETPGPQDSIYNYANGQEPLLNTASLPEKYVTPNLPDLRDQGSFNSCWAHSSTALAEINLIKKGLATTSINLSELHLVYFTFNAPTDPLGGTAGDTTNRKSNLDTGGNLSDTSKIYSRWIGAASEELVPYSSAYKVVWSGTKLDDNLAYNDFAHMENYYEVKPYETEAMKQLVYDYGAVGVSFKSEGWSNYYDYEYNSFYYPEADETDHSVTIVGWDDTFSKDHFSNEDNLKPEADGAWLIRNSWASPADYDYEDEIYSMNGYFWMSYYDKSLTEIVYYNKSAYAFDFNTSDNYDNNYHYDGAAQYR